MIPVIETTKFRQAPVAKRHEGILDDPQAVRDRVAHLTGLANAFLEAGAPAIAGEKLLEAGLIARAHGRVMTQAWAQAVAEATEAANGQT